MMLFTKDIDKKLFQQYDMGSNLEKQKVIAKIFNPYGNGRWFLINSDPNDPNYLWAIVQMGDTVEVGSVSRQDLISARVGRFRFPLERDLGFSPVNAAELFRGLNQGKFYADGGIMPKGAVIDSYQVAVDGKANPLEINEFISYCNEFYGKNGVYSKDLNGGFSLREIRAAVMQYLEGLGKQNTWGNGDSLDRERVRDILKPSYKMADGGETEVEEEQTVTRGFYEDEPYEYADGGEFERAAVRMANNPNWTNEKLLKEYNENKFYLSEFNAGYLKPSKVIGGGYKSSAVAKRLAKEYLEKTVAQYKMALELRGVMAKGGGVDRYKNFDINSEGNYAANVNGKNYEIIYRDDISEMYDLFEDGKKINSSKSVRDVMKFADGGYMANGGGFNQNGEAYGFDKDEYYDMISQYDKLCAFYEDAESDIERKKLNVKINALEDKINAYERMEHGGYMAKGGMVVTSIKDIPNFKQRLDEGKITYRGLGLGKLWDDFNKLTGTTGTRIKVDKKEYFITDEEFNTFSRGADGKLRIRFEAPFRKSYEDGGYMAKGGKVEMIVLPKYKNKFDKFLKEKNVKPIGFYYSEEDNKYYYTFNNESEREKIFIEFDNSLYDKMNIGGKVTFDDKVSSIKKSLLKKKTVSPKVQKDYGKTYNKKEALESAKRIAGAMRAKYKN